VLQHRAVWSHQGGTWGVPGGARASTESVVEAALRETAEEAGIDPGAVRPTGILVDEHGGWSYSTVLAEPLAPVRPRPTGGESVEVRWVDVGAVESLPLHPGFRSAWPRLRSAPPGLVLVVDAANVVGARGGGDGWWRDRAGATRRLVEALTPLATATGVPAGDLPPEVDPGSLDVVLPRIRVVVEGAARRVLQDGSPAGVELVGSPGSGDDTIVETAAKVPPGHGVLTVTADRGLRARLAAAGVPAVGPSWLLLLVEGRRSRR